MVPLPMVAHELAEGAWDDADGAGLVEVSGGEIAVVAGSILGVLALLGRRAPPPGAWKEDAVVGYLDGKFLSPKAWGMLIR